MTEYQKMPNVHFVKNSFLWEALHLAWQKLKNIVKILATRKTWVQIFFFALVSKIM